MMHNNDDIAEISGLTRFENNSLDEMKEQCMDLTHSIYPHETIYGEYCTIQQYIDCHPDEAFSYLSTTEALQEWTYSTRDPIKIDDNGLYQFTDKLGGDNTKLFCQTITNKQAMTIDYHCAWDQCKHLWMIYLLRVIPAALVFNKPGSVVTWTNCRHPFYDKNPFQEAAPALRQEWVGDAWPMFYAGHTIEMNNLKRILEYRHEHGIRISDANSLAV